VDASRSGSQPAYQWKRPQFIANPFLRYGLIILGAAYLIWAISSLSISWDRVVQGIPRAINIFSRAWPPDFSRSSLIINGFTESIQIAIFATALGILVSVPIALLASSNIVPRAVYFIGRGVIILARSFHPVIVAIIFVKAVGFGPFAGVLTLMVYSLGFVGKLLAEAIEEIDEGQVEAVRASGAGPMKVLLYGVFPQIMPRQIGLSIYQLDSNLRASAVVGVVGAGGIGGTLMNAFKRFDYDFAFAILLLIIAIILVSEAVSGRIRSSVS
jgi:phosphonate transport system permease protein